MHMYKNRAHDKIDDEHIHDKFYCNMMRVVSQKYRLKWNFDFNNDNENENDLIVTKKSRIENSSKEKLIIKNKVFRLGKKLFWIKKENEICTKIKNQRKQNYFIL